MAKIVQFEAMEPMEPSLNTRASSLSHIPQEPLLSRFIDSFKRHPGNYSMPPANITLGGIYNINDAAEATACSPLRRSLNSRHLQMITIGGSVGTGLFIGSGSALATGGPASLLISFGLVGVAIYCTVHALGELAVIFPLAGSYAAYFTRFLDPAWGFAMGWNYAFGWLILMPVEIVAGALTIDFWKTSISHKVWATILLPVPITINLFGVRGFGEAEFVFSTIKVLAVLGFIVLGIVLNCANTPDGGYIGTKYWRDPGAFNNGFKGTCSVFVMANFAFAGTELVGLAAAEAANPLRSLPRAVKQVFWRITLYYIVSFIIIGMLVPYNSPQLLNGMSSADIKASPFVIAISTAGINALPSIFNSVILISVLSVGSSAVYTTSRTLSALADQGQAPKILGYIDHKGRPLVAIGVASLAGFLALFAGSDRTLHAFNWILALSGLSSVLTWASICLAHIRFRSAWLKHGHSLEELTFRSQAGVIGSWVGLFINCLILLVQLWTAVWPIGYESMTAREIIVSVFAAYLTLPVVMILYVSYKVRYRTSIVTINSMDLYTGLQNLTTPELAAMEQEEQAHWPVWKKVLKFCC
ncbi:hypothetical protein K470DRAFT_254890 [Piedraia hortae CBS 480.64]|uniref:Amino acid permease/ SLC12A domain-containing protein n=1 Tax=Piedraia hortae CBS 480.64 TaxID=1314780 RepID=A0A6A7C837_9PEZI|nr:hypothetical protein K470DRAFT_254890 [Piedraia hortae CBS 480.64]